MLAVILVNPTARGGSSTGAVDVVRERLEAEGYTVATLTPASAAAAEQELRELAVNADLVVAVGGDGTVNIAANVLAGTDIPLGIMPVGSGNDFAQTFGITELDIERAAEIIATGDSQPVDLAVLTGAEGNRRRFASVFASGFDSLVNDRANRLRWPRGHQRYNLAIAIEFFLLKRVHYSVRWVTPDGESGSEADTFLMATVANTRSYGGGIEISPRSNPTDGTFELVLVKPAGRLRLLLLLSRVFRAKHLTDPLFQIREVSEVHLDTADTRGYADGDPIGAFPVSITVDPGALRLIVPEAGSTWERTV